MYPVIKIFNYYIPTVRIIFIFAFGLFSFLFIKELLQNGYNCKISIPFLTIFFISVIIFSKINKMFSRTVKNIKNCPKLIYNYEKLGITWFALLGYIIIIYLFNYIWSIPFRIFSDILTPSMALFISIRRIGCLFNGCCRGRYTKSIIGIRYPKTGFKVHPVQIYESILGIIIFFILIFFKNHHIFIGKLLFVYILLYALCRFIVEFFRAGKRIFGKRLTLAQIVSLVILLIDGGILYLI
jgi:phosphatidylglycerol:prolipoprotein diacylglycerol transferase